MVSYMSRRGEKLLSSWAPCVMTKQWMMAVRRRNHMLSSTTTKQKEEWTQWINWLATTHVRGEPQGTTCWMMPPLMPTPTSPHNTLVIWVVWTWKLTIHQLLRVILFWLVTFSQFTVQFSSCVICYHVIVIVMILRSCCPFHIFPICLILPFSVSGSYQ